MTQAPGEAHCLPPGSRALGNCAGRAVLIEGSSYFDLERISAGRYGPGVMGAIPVLDQLDAFDLRGVEAAGQVESAALDCPVPAPAQIFAIGLNYRAHGAEFGVEAPDFPTVFTKFPGALAGPDDTVYLGGERVDWEVELVAVIGQRCWQATVAEAHACIAGYTVGQDISDRELQFMGNLPQFSLAKSRRGFAPIGPWVVPASGLNIAAGLGVQCSVSGELMQSGNTAAMIFDVPILVSYLSQHLPLGAGDLIFTGTPEGVGMSRDRYLRPGDVIESSIDGIGVLRNQCCATDAPVALKPRLAR